MRSFTVGRVAASRHPDFHQGDFVTGLFGWQDYAAVDGSSIQRRITETDLPISTALGVLGLNGLTAYFALLELGQPKANETVAVSTAAGAVGSCVGQTPASDPLVGPPGPKTVTFSVQRVAPQPSRPGDPRGPWTSAGEIDTTLDLEQIELPQR